jgi:hypothetical protein
MWRLGRLCQVFAATQVESKHFASHVMAKPWPLGHVIVPFIFGTCLLTEFDEIVTREVKAKPSQRLMRFTARFKMERHIAALIF